MKLYPRVGLLIGVIFSWLFWCSLSFAQVEILSDEEHRQEAQTYVITPCFEEVGQAAIKAMKINDQQLTGAEFLRVMSSGESKKIENKLIEKLLEDTKNKPKTDRMIWYKIATSVCVNAWKEKLLDNEFFSAMTPSTKSLKPKDEPLSLTNKKSSNSSDSVSDQAKQQAIKTCKESLQILGSDVPYTYLNFCIERELQAYQEFQRNYGD